MSVTPLLQFGPNHTGLSLRCAHVLPRCVLVLTTAHHIPMTHHFFLKGTITLAAETTRSLSGLTLPAYVDLSACDLYCILNVIKLKGVGV